jgi:hypothetical protein
VGRARSLGSWLEVLLMLGDRRFLIWGSLPLVLWLLVYDSGFGRLPSFDEMLMIPSPPSPKTDCCYLKHDGVSLIDVTSTIEVSSKNRENNALIIMTSRVSCI